MRFVRRRGSFFFLVDWSDLIRFDRSLVCSDRIWDLSAQYLCMPFLCRSVATGLDSDKATGTRYNRGLSLVLIAWTFTAAAATAAAATAAAATAAAAVSPGVTIFVTD